MIVLCEEEDVSGFLPRTHKIPPLLGKLLHLTVDLLRKDPNYYKKGYNGMAFVSELAAKSDLRRPEMERLGKFARAKHGAFDCKN
jgi:hypothetical protein